MVHYERSFNFLNDVEESDRKLSFETLLGMPSGTVTLLSDEISRQKIEYETMLVNIAEILRIEGVWYSLFTEERFYRNCKFLNHYALQFLNRSFNECIVESEVSNIEDIQSSERNLTSENADKLNSISFNGPH